MWAWKSNQIVHRRYKQSYYGVDSGLEIWTTEYSMGITELPMQLKFYTSIFTEYTAVFNGGLRTETPTQMLGKIFWCTNPKEQNSHLHCTAYKHMKDVAITCILKAVNVLKYACSQGSASDSAGGAYSAPWPLARFGEGKEGRGREGREEERRGAERWEGERLDPKKKSWLWNWLNKWQYHKGSSHIKLSHLLFTSAIITVFSVSETQSQLFLHWCVKFKFNFKSMVLY